MVESNEVLNGNFGTSRRYIPGGHNGIDFRAPTGTQVKARFSGIVRVTGTNPPGKDFGNYIRIFHPQLNISTWYAHLQSWSVGVGQQVYQGQVIGISNNTGLSTGPHLHFGQSKGESTQWFDPDTTQGGGGEMVTQDMLEKLYNGFFHRHPDSNAQGYVGKPVAEVIASLWSSQEHSIVEGQWASAPALQNQVNDLTNQINAINAQLAGANAQIADQDTKIKEQTEQLANLNTTIEAQATQILALQEQINSGGTTKPLEPTFANIVELIRQFIVKWTK